MDTQIKQEQFRKEFESIVGMRYAIQKNRNRLKNLHSWDKNGSHERAITKALEVRKGLTDKLNIMLKGVLYEDWLATSKRISALNSRLKKAIAQKERVENELTKLEFPL